MKSKTFIIIFWTLIVVLALIEMTVVLQKINIDSSEIDRGFLDEISLPSHSQGGGFIGEGSIEWDFEITEDWKEEVEVIPSEFNRSIIEVLLSDHANSTTGNNYKWDMALCNNTVGDLKYMNEDAQGGFNNSVWLDVNYGKLTDFGLNETWCGQSDNFGYVLFSSGSKNQFPKKIRLLMDTITDFNLYAGTGSAVFIATANNIATRGIGENICRDSNGLLHVTYEGINDNLRYANSSDDGATWGLLQITMGDISSPLITCGETNLTIVFNNESNGNIEFVVSSNDGGTWTTEETAIDGGINAVSRPSCAVDSNDIVHCVGRDGLQEMFFYTNSSNWNTLVELADQDTTLNNTDHADIEVDSSNNVYIIGTGDVQDDVDIWSSIDGYATRNPIADALGNVNVNLASGKMGMAISTDGKIYYAGPHQIDLQFCNGTTSDWNGGASSWSCQETAIQESRGTDIASTLAGDIHILHEDDNNVANSDMLRTNSSDGGVTFESRTNINAASARQPAISASLFSTSNRVNDTIRYVFANTTGVFYDSYLVTPEPAGDTCTYVSGDYVVELSDNCVITDLQDASGNTFVLQGDIGSFTIASGGEVRCNSFTFVPDDIDLDSHYHVAVGGKGCGNEV